MITTPEKLKKLRELIAKHMEALGVRVLGAESMGATKLEIEAMEREGILPKGSSLEVDPIGDGYRFGGYRAKAERGGRSVIDHKLSDFHRAAGSMALSRVEALAIENARQWAGSYAVGLGNRMSDQIISVLNAEDMKLRQDMVQMIRSEVARGMATRDSLDTISANLREMTGDWARDWRRIVSTEVHNAQEVGAAQDIAETFGRAARVAKIPNLDACPDCRRVYLDENERPKTYTLYELISNGTNVGRKRRAWLPTITAIHPWCRCRLVYLPEGWGFNKDWEIVPPEELHL